MSVKAKIMAMKPSTDSEGLSDVGDKGEPAEHEVSHWADTLLKAEDIKCDPHKMKHVDMHLAKKQKAIKSVADLRKRAKLLKMD